MFGAGDRRVADRSRARKYALGTLARSSFDDRERAAAGVGSDLESPGSLVEPRLHRALDGDAVAGRGRGAG